jgi:hypothetical protein
MAISTSSNGKSRKPSDKVINGASRIKATKKPGERKRKLNTDKVRQLAARGVIPTDIARQQGVSVSTVTRYLQSIGQQTSDIKQFSFIKAEALAASQLKAGAIADVILDAWLSDPDKYLLSQDLRLQKEILVAVQGVKTYDHNQERLERGQATSITDVRSLMIELDAAEAMALQRLSHGKE